MQAAINNQFPTQLRQWRRSRKRSQLDLSLDAGISQRHLSFLECGRSAPSRSMVLQLADALKLPLREQNALLISAGFVAAYRERQLDEAAMEPVRDALQRALDHHNPYPALVVDKAWNLLMANESLLGLFGMVDGLLESCQRICGDGPLNIVKLSFHPEGLRAHTQNWQLVALHLLNRLRREARETDSAELWALVNEVLNYDGVPDSWEQPDWEQTPEPVLSVEMRLDDIELRLFSMIASFGTAQDITADELRMELMFPADKPSRALLLARAAVN